MYVPIITYSNEVNLIKMFEVTPIYADIDRPPPPPPHSYNILRLCNYLRKLLYLFFAILWPLCITMRAVCQLPRVQLSVQALFVHVYIFFSIFLATQYKKNASYPITVWPISYPLGTATLSI